ncbi:unnamed protein product [Candida verbasci]|uniref:RFX-type winged-helix domain-containing protein n=1 Tax=Candida verbasci TaxID=1227364 RepID=A0A9W4TR08_9ASCO|nr:unnamed protein product [Candida verbasci]
MNLDDSQQQQITQNQNQNQNQQYLHQQQNQNLQHSPQQSFYRQQQHQFSQPLPISSLGQQRIPENYQQQQQLIENAQNFPFIKQEQIDLSQQVYPNFYNQLPQSTENIIPQSFQFDYQTPQIPPPTAPQQQQQQIPQQISPQQPPILESIPNEPIIKQTPTPRRKKQKSESNEPPGENELKQLAIKQSEVPLSELAMRIKQLENELPQESQLEQSRIKEQKETQRSLFGMVWLLNSCEASPTAVIPRNRIYARYVQVCADNNLSPLSPASFGKLVKILYPSITTRRLGMRGQSKYHYCGVKLKGDQNMQMQQQQQILNLKQPQPQPQQLQMGLGSGFTIHSPVSSTNSSISFEDSPISRSQVNTPSYTPINSPSITTTSINSLADQLPSVSHMKYIPNLFEMLNNNSISPDTNPYSPINLPSIYPYLTKDVDYDIADTLYSLYKVHINSIFESVRFMQLKKLLSCFVNFNNILTAPVSKLYCQDFLIGWVKKCDTIMYKKIVRMLVKLQLQFILPNTVSNEQLKIISTNYLKTLSNSLINSKVSKNFIIMKLKLAKHFVNLLNRLIKIIETGLPASRILVNLNEKDLMFKDWIKLDLNELIQREMPCNNDKNLNTLTYILNHEVTNLIKTNEYGIMQSVASYLSKLPGRFNDINPRLFLLLASNLLTACLREISLSGGEGFGAWWIVRCWIDEYLAWVVELGGFFKDDLIEEKLPIQEQELRRPSNLIIQEQEPNENNNTASIDLLETSFEYDKD